MPEGTPPSDAPAGDPTPPTETTSEQTETPSPDKATSAEELARQRVETEKWRALSRQHEEQNAKTAKELDALRRKSMTDQERAVAEAQDAGYKRAVADLGGKLVDAEIRTVAAGRLSTEQLGFLFQGLNRSVFLLEDGSVDAKSVQTFVDGLAPKPEPEQEQPPQSPQFPDLGQGVRGVAPAQSSSEFERALRSVVGAPPR